jgi:hypothetical protein
MIIIEPIVENTSSGEALQQLQLIVNTFTDAIEKNNCNLKLVIGFHQQLDDAIRDVEDLNVALQPDIKGTLKATPTYTYYTVDPSRFIDDVITINDSSKYLKQKCIDCKLRFPTVKFDNRLKFSFDKLFEINIAYSKIFTDFQKPNICHLAYAMESSCIPDLIKLIALLLNAYIAILAFKKLSGFTLTAFIKGLILSLLGKIIGSISVSVNFSNTGLPCVLAAIENIASAIPSPDNLRSQISANIRDETGFYADKQIGNNTELLRQLNSGEIAQEEYDKIITDYQQSEVIEKNYYSNLQESVGTGLNKSTSFLKSIEGSVSDVENGISDIFKFANDVVTEAQAELNSFIESIFGIITYFECEISRTTADFTVILELATKITNLINAISAIVVVLAKKQLGGKLCKETSLNSKYSNDTTVNFTAEDIKDIVQEYTGVISKLEDADGISVLIYEQPIRQILPKLDLFSCNLEEFTKGHELDNIVDAVVKDLIESGGNSSLNLDNNVDGDTYTQPDKQYIRKFDIPGYTPSTTDSEEDYADAVKQQAEETYSNYITEVRELLDFIYNNPLNSVQDDYTDKEEVTAESDDIVNMFNNLKSNKVTENLSNQQKECRDIDDVLAMLKNFTF